jgi:hypothetical protein
MKKRTGWDQNLRTLLALAGVALAASACNPAARAPGESVSRPLPKAPNQGAWRLNDADRRELVGMNGRPRTDVMRVLARVLERVTKDVPPELVMDQLDRSLELECGLLATSLCSLKNREDQGDE